MISRRPTIDDVARLAGVSIKTVSRVFNRAPNVRPATRDKVVAAAETLNYQPNLSARQLASNRTFLVGMLYDNPNPENENDYVTAVQSGSLEACRENGYKLLINPCRADSPGLIDEVIGLSRQVDGFIVLQPLSDVPSLNQALLENQIACVRVSQRPLEGFPWISVGDAEAADRHDRVPSAARSPADRVHRGASGPWPEPRSTRRLSPRPRKARHRLR